MGNRITKVTTKKGDTGLTSFGTSKEGCNLIYKGHPAIELLGVIDELNANIGLLKANLSSDLDMKLQLENIQQTLFDIGGEVFMNDPSKILVSDKNTLFLEECISSYLSTLPPLVDFVLPGNNVSSSLAHISRAVCRRAEFTAFKFLEIMFSKNKALENVPAYLKYLNRLSDYLFVLARVLSKTGQTKEIVWHKKTRKEV